MAGKEVPLETTGHEVRLCFIRHGQSKAQMAPRCLRRTALYRDAGLTQNGIKQAKSLPQLLADAGFEPDLIVCSGLTRALQTACIGFESVLLRGSELSSEGKGSIKDYELSGKGSRDGRKQRTEKGGREAKGTLGEDKMEQSDETEKEIGKTEKEIEGMASDEGEATAGKTKKSVQESKMMSGQSKRERIKLLVRADICEVGDIPENQPRGLEKLRSDPVLTRLPAFRFADFSCVPKSWPHMVVMDAQPNINSFLKWLRTLQQVCFNLLTQSLSPIQCSSLTFPQLSAKEKRVAVVTHSHYIKYLFNRDIKDRKDRVFNAAPILCTLKEVEDKARRAIDSGGIRARVRFFLPS